MRFIIWRTIGFVFCLAIGLSSCGWLGSPIGPSPVSVPTPVPTPCTPTNLSVPSASAVPNVPASNLVCQISLASVPSGGSFGQFVRLPSIGCQGSGLAVLRNQGDWMTYQASSPCNATVAGALDCFDFSKYTVLSLQYLNCSQTDTRQSGIHIVDVGVYSGVILILTSDSNGGNIAVGLAPHVVCSTDVVAIPATGLPVQVVNVMTCPSP